TPGRSRAGVEAVAAPANGTTASSWSSAGRARRRGSLGSFWHGLPNGRHLPQMSRREEGVAGEAFMADRRGSRRIRAASRLPITRDEAPVRLGTRCNMDQMLERSHGCQAIALLQSGTPVAKQRVGLGARQPEGTLERCAGLGRAPQSQERIPSHDMAVGGLGSESDRPTGFVERETEFVL